MRHTKPKKPNFSGLTLEQALQLVPTEKLLRWTIDAAPRPPSPTLSIMFQRLESFALTTSEAAKLTLIDTILAEIVPEHPRLKIWKAAPLETKTIAGIADYLIAPNRAYIKTPLLCAIEAKRDDFEAGEVQCVAEMAVCLQNNRRDGHEADVYGIVSNGQGWVFYRLTPRTDVYVSELYGLRDLPTLLGALDFVCAACAQNVPASVAV